MHRLFLDANVLFSAGYRAHAGLLALWKTKRAVLLSSQYAVEEARINLDLAVQKRRLERLVRRLQLLEAAGCQVPRGVTLPEKDVPILLAAIEARATHLITGDLRHFGSWFNRRIAGILVLTPGEYLRTHRSR